jgi:hypothetical protein
MIQNSMLARSSVLKRASPATSSLAAITSIQIRRPRPRLDYRASKEHNRFLPTPILDDQKKTKLIRIMETWSRLLKIWLGNSE